MSENCSYIGVQVAITSGCAVWYRGNIVFAASEERFSRIKNEVGYPYRAVAAALRWCDDCGIPRPRTAVIVSENMDFRHYMMRRESTFSVADYIREQHAYYYPRFFKGHAPSYEDIFPEKFDYSDISRDMADRFRAAGDPRRLFREWREAVTRRETGASDVVCMNHEHAHAAYGLYATDASREDALVMTVDGFGDAANCSIWTADRGRLHCHRTYDNFDIGRIYRYITLLLGMKPNEHEYKVMGLAPYADDAYANAVADVFRRTLRVDPQNGELRYHEKPTDSYFYFKNRLEGHRFDAIAGGLQLYTEELLCDMARYWLRKLGKRHIVLSGGVSLNIKASRRIGELQEVDRVAVPASAGDESQCIGALYAYAEAIGRGEENRPLTHMYLGTGHSQAEMDAAAEGYVGSGRAYTLSRGVGPDDIAALLADGKVIARFSGRMEFGARALGNRSILAHPGYPDIVRKINAQIKHRDFWMPFSASILSACADNYLVNPKHFDSPFMTLAFPSTAEARRQIPGALHPADFTLRPQLVRESENGGYHRLIEAFRRRTGVGGLLNTSLNLSGLPICASPEDLFHVLDRSRLDGALLGTTLLLRNEAKNG